MQIKITRVKVSGFSNINKFSLSLSKFTSLLGLNNYGKSNAIKSISFGFDFIKAPSNEKIKMMAIKSLIPYNENINTKKYDFEFECLIIADKKNYHVAQYSFSFQWANSIHPGKILNERLRIKKNLKGAKYKDYIKRNKGSSKYLRSESGRCDISIPINENSLVLTKIANFDNLFYRKIIEEILNIKVTYINTLQDSEGLFRTFDPETVRPEYSLSMPESFEAAFFIASLEELKPDTFALLLDSINSLFPHIEEFKPIKINVKRNKEYNEHSEFPEYLYDIQIKESYNRESRPISFLSTGTQRIIYTISFIVAAEINGYSVALIEELENSIHPSLFQKLLVIIDALTEHINVLTTSHSPYLIQYIDLRDIYIGTPNNKGLAQFTQIKPNKIQKVLSLAESQGVSAGDIIFDQVIECSSGDSDLFDELCEEIKDA